MPDWSREEVEATVADYLVMLRAERSGLPFNKSEHRRSLARMLNGRTDGSIERKHQNISAVLIVLGMPYIEGYKPLGNYQQLLFDVAASQVARASDLHAVLQREIAMAVAVPTFDNILDALVPPPVAPTSPGIPYADRVRELKPVPRLVDYPALEATQRAVGLAGEQFALQFEQARLLAAGKSRLAAKVEHVSANRGDGAGYDILSFDTDGRERLIEVKTTAYGPATPFFVTRNEVATSQRSAKQYHLYRIFDLRRRVRFFQKSGQLDASFWLDPVQYAARVRDA